jgi:hypothetical protein
VLLDPHVLPPWLGWRVCFGLGRCSEWPSSSSAATSRRAPVAPAPRAARGGRAAGPGHRGGGQRAARAPACARGTLLLRPGAGLDYAAIARILFRRHRRRAVLGLSLMVAQAFAYNAVFFTYGLVLGKFYWVPADRIGLYLCPSRSETWPARSCWASLRHHRAPEDDHPHLRRLRAAAPRHRLGVRRGWLTAETQTISGAGCSSSPLRGERGLPHRLRAVSGGHARAGHRALLRGGHRRGRPPRAGALRSAHRLGSRVQVALGDALGRA